MLGSLKSKGVLKEEDGLSYNRHRECINGKKKKRIEDDGRIEKYLRKMKNINRTGEEKKGGFSLSPELITRNLSPCVVDYSFINKIIGEL